MPLIRYLDIAVPNVYQRVGLIEHLHESQTDLRPRKPFEAQRYGMLVHWPRSLAWLSVSLRYGDPQEEFKEHHDAVREVCKAVGADPNHVAPPKFLESQAYQVALMGPDSPIHFRLRIDTEHEGFRQAVLAQEGAIEREEFQQPIYVRFFDAKTLGVYLDQEGVVTLLMRPAKPVPPFDGFAALDLGNTSSTMVGQSLTDGHYSTKSIRIVDAEAFRGKFQEHAEPVVSSVRIDRLRSFDPVAGGTRRFPSQARDDFSQAINWVVGRLASPQDGAGGSEAATAGLVLGAKRLIAGKDWEKTQKLKALHWNKAEKSEQFEQVEVLNRVPAELLICRLMQKFREAGHAWPRSLAITYPTTYSPRELEQLREVVQRAWLRMQSRPQTAAGSSDGDAADLDLEKATLALQQQIFARQHNTEPGDDPVIRLLVDEASAAAFFFLYRRIFEEPGGLPRFRYLFPNGLNMLLYDCGGGTTDIALVRASFDPERADLLRLTVLARSGLRGFGGDDITRAVCRILKAKIAQKVGEVRGRPLKLAWPAPPTGVIERHPRLAAQHKGLEEAFAKLKEADPRDELVPTTFDPDQSDDAGNRRRDHAFDLWRWGEEMKRRLEKADSANFLRIDRNLSRLSAALLKGLSDVQAQQLIGQLEKITIQRWEVDALVEASVLKSIRNCNNLIRDQLTTGRANDDEDEVDWVVVSGNASRYPLVQELLRKLLHVPFIDDGRFTLDEKNLKHAVAKGAVLALSTLEAVGSVQIEFDSDLSNRLPFDVGYKELRTNTNPILYREHTPYERLKPKAIPMTSLKLGSSGGRKVEKFVLERRFPGDDGFTPYLAFHFPDGIQGDLEVAYDPHQREFTVRDTRTNSFGESKDVADTSIYRSPAQRGDL
jgi:hypothetical protein